MARSTWLVVRDERFDLRYEITSHGDYWDFIGALVAQANDAGFEVVRERRGSANGFCDFMAKRIAVRPDVSHLQAVKTLVHELGHALLHADDQPESTDQAEVEVESVP